MQIAPVTIGDTVHFHSDSRIFTGILMQTEDFKTQRHYGIAVMTSDDEDQAARAVWAQREGFLKWAASGQLRVRHTHRLIGQDGRFVGAGSLSECRLLAQEHPGSEIVENRTDLDHEDSFAPAYYGMMPS